MPLWPGPLLYSASSPSPLRGSLRFDNSFHLLRLPYWLPLRLSLLSSAHRKEIVPPPSVSLWPVPMSFRILSSYPDGLWPFRNLASGPPVFCYGFPAAYSGSQGRSRLFRSSHGHVPGLFWQLLLYSSAHQETWIALHASSGGPPGSSPGLHIEPGPDPALTLGLTRIYCSSWRSA